MKSLQHPIRRRPQPQSSVSPEWQWQNTQLGRWWGYRGPARAQRLELLLDVQQERCMCVCVCVCVYLCPIVCVLDKAPRLRIHSISIHWQRLHIQSHEARERERETENESRAFHNPPNTPPASQLWCLECVYFPHYSWFSCMLPSLPPFTVSTTLSRPDERPFQ